MFHRWSSFVFRRSKLVLALSGLSLIIAIAGMITAGGALSSSGFVDPSSESSKVTEQLANDFGRGREQLIFIFDAGKPVSDPSVQTRVEQAVAPVAADGRVAQVLTAWSGGSPAFIAKDGNSTYAVALLNVADDDAATTLDDLLPKVKAIADPAGLNVSVSGQPAFGKDISTRVTEGIALAESVSIPLTIVILLIVFGTVFAAGLPLLVGALAMGTAIAAVVILANVTQQSIFAINIITLLGLALGVDYSLFMVARFREELRTKSTEDALDRTIATTGKAILSSGITVIFGLAATLFFPVPALRSMGLAGMIVVFMALVFGLTFLPAMLAVLGPRINKYNVRFWRRRAPAAAGAEETSPFWRGVAQQVMRRPVAVLLPVLTALLIAATPFFGLSLTPGGPEILPISAPSRIAFDRLASDFPSGEADPTPVIVTLSKSGSFDAATLSALRAYVEAASSVAHVARVESILTDPATASIDWSRFSGDPSSLPEAAQAIFGRYVRGNVTLVQIVADVDGDRLDSVVKDLRGISVSGLETQVGGSAGISVDTIDGIMSGLTPAIIFVVLGSYLILLLTFGSVFLPIKAIFMTMLSIGASLGALVLVFQDGHGESLLGFTASGQIISTTPILMFCILFGLSMDYEVLMLTRIQEEYSRTGDNRASVAFGLERTAKTITSAAAIMVVAFGAFMLADVVVIKSLGFGLTLAVVIDATIVRGLLVPAAMRLLGRWNWWAPAPITRVVDRLGLGHAEIRPSTASLGSPAD